MPSRTKPVRPDNPENRKPRSRASRRRRNPRSRRRNRKPLSHPRASRRKLPSRRRRRRPPSIDDQVRVLAQELNLNDDQQGKIKTVLVDQRQQASTVIADNSLTRDD